MFSKNVYPQKILLLESQMRILFHKVLGEIKKFSVYIGQNKLEAVLLVPDLKLW